MMKAASSISWRRTTAAMRDTGADMKLKYKETARGGLAVNVVEIPVSVWFTGLKRTTVRIGGFAP